MKYLLYNADKPVGAFDYENGTISRFDVLRAELLPMQVRCASADGFTRWLKERSIDLNTFQHRQLANNLFGSRDKTAIAIRNHMFSISDTFTCFREGEFIPRDRLCCIEDQNIVSDFILGSSDTSIRLNRPITPNASTDGSFPKTWRFESGAWWLYKMQSSDATRSEREISRVLIECGWEATEYQYVGNYRTRIRSRNFVGTDEFFEPYDSLRFLFDDKSDNDETIYENIASLGADFEKAYRRILLADAFFTNIDRHMRNFGVIRSAKTGDLLRMAPNFDNNQAYRANPDGTCSDRMLHGFQHTFGLTSADLTDLNQLVEASRSNKYLSDAADVGEGFLKGI